ncbi:hypothetical protein, partial [Telluria aromaticivorans]|uniref:hypothetical protein n=1 Tax=Telluria aromaticivorans TaxID=2725995 RepID=UPI001BB1C8D4
WHLHQTPTLIDCKFLKNFVWYCLAALDEALCSSAAEKREYAVFRLTRQPLRFASLQIFLRTSSW